MQISVPLLDVEASYISLEAISTITFFRGDCNLQQLRGRVRKILILNPWLQGRLIRHNEKIHLLYSNEPIYDNFFVVRQENWFNLEMPYNNIVSITSALVVKPGNLCVGTLEPLFKVTAVCTGEKTFALIVSLSHVIADGHTFYKLYGMLSHNSIPIALEVNRFHEFRTSVHKLMGDDTSSYLASPGFLVSAARNIVFGGASNITLNKIDLKWIQAQKEDYKHLNEKNDSHFISTNDILTSWFFNICGSNVGIIPINFRHRIADLTDGHAGNYESQLAYRSKDFLSPHLIRQSLIHGYRRQVTQSMPRFWESISSKTCMLSSWVSIYIHLELDDCEHLVHFPLRGMEKTPFSDLAIIFRLNQTDLGLLSVTRSLTTDAIQQEPAIAPDNPFAFVV